MIRNLRKEFAYEAKKSAKVTSDAPKIATCLNEKRRNTGPFAKPMRLVKAWFIWNETL